MTGRIGGKTWIKQILNFLLDQRISRWLYLNR